MSDDTPPGWTGNLDLMSVSELEEVTRDPYVPPLLVAYAARKLRLRRAVYHGKWLTAWGLRRELKLLFNRLPAEYRW